LMKKVERAGQISSFADREETPALLEPRPGYSDDDVISSLEESGASEVELLAPGFISAQIKPRSLRALEVVAFVHPKRRKQMNAV
jgi:hypothetical protein